MKIIPKSKFNHNSNKGLAIVLVFAVITGLFVIAVPFTYSMLQGRNSALQLRDYAKAKQDINSIRALTYAHLANAQTIYQQQARETGSSAPIVSALTRRQIPLNNPSWTSKDEFWVQPFLSDDLRPPSTARRQFAPAIDIVTGNDRIWTVNVQDTQSKIDLNTASFYVLGNLMRASSLTADLNENNTVSASVSDAGAYPKEDGYFMLGRELIGYDRAFSGSDANAFYTLTRAAQGRPAEFASSAGYYRQEMTVAYPAVAYKIATAKFDLSPSPSELYEFPFIDDIRGISRWTKFNGSASDAITAQDFDEISDLLTTHASGVYPGTFFAPRVLLNNVPQGQQQGDTATLNDTQILHVENNIAINNGSVLKITSDDGTIRYCLAKEVRQNFIIIDRVLDYPFYERRAIVEVQARKPVNINTASIRTLVAIFSGLSTGISDIINSGEARAAANVIYSRIHLNPEGINPFTSAAEFITFVRREYANWGLSSNDVNALIINATRNYDPRLRSPTMPFTFRSYDTYQIEYSTLVNNAPRRMIDGVPAPGIVRAKYSAEEIRRIGCNDYLGKYNHLGIADFITARDELFTGSGFWLQSFSRGARGDYVTAELPIAPQRTGDNILDYPNLGQDIENEETINLDSSLIARQQDETFDLQTSSLFFWFKIDDFDRDRVTVIFDIAEEQYSNRLSFFYDNFRHALVLRMLAADRHKAAMEFIFQLGQGDAIMRSGVFYHAMLTWKGTEFRNILQGARIKPQFNLLIDGIGASPIIRIPGHFTHTYYPEGFEHRGIPIYNYLTQTLAQPLDNYYNAESHEIHLVNAAMFPNSGVIQIGNEVLVYTNKQDNVLMGGTPITEYDEDGNPTGNYFPSGIIRGARGSTHSIHNVGAAVSLWGYSLMLQSDTLAPNLPAVKGMLQSRLGPQTGPSGMVQIWNEDRVNSEYENYTDEGPEAGLPSGFDMLCVEKGVVDDFPERGFILVYGDVIEDYVKDEETGVMRAQFANPRTLGEIIYYEGKYSDVTSNLIEFDYLRIRRRNAIPWQGNPSNALLMPPGGYHFRNYSQFMLISLELDDLTNYHQNGGYVFLSGSNFEIIRYTELNTQFAPFLVYNLDWNNWRGAFGSRRSSFSIREAKCLPIFMINSNEGTITRAAGVGDEVTVVQSRASNRVNLEMDNSTELRIIWARIATNNQTQWVALSDFVPYTYIPGNGTRLIKFPSCELPVNLPETFTLGGPSQEFGNEYGFAGTFDEIEWFSSSAANFQLVNNITDDNPDGGITPTDTEIPVNRITGMNRGVGIIRVNDELIAYSGIQNNRLMNCTRGFLGTIPSYHSGGANFLNLSHLTIVSLRGEHSASTAHRLNIRSIQGDIGNSGYLLGGTDPFNLEIFAYHRRGSRYLFSEYQPDGAGLYRGMFGTPTYDFVNNNVMIKLPYRYQDKFKTRNIANKAVFANTPEQICTGGAHAEPGATWVRAHWAILDDPKLRRIEGQYIRIHLFVKPSNAPSWAQARHYIFNHNGGGTGAIEPSTIVTEQSSIQQVDELNIRSDGIEWRVGFEFVDNAFRFDSWKWSPVFLGIYFEYEQSGRVFVFKEK